MDASKLLSLHADDAAFLKKHFHDEVVLNLPVLTSKKPLRASDARNTYEQIGDPIEVSLGPDDQEGVTFDVSQLPEGCIIAAHSWSGVSGYAEAGVDKGDVKVIEWLAVIGAIASFLDLLQTMWGHLSKDMKDFSAKFRQTPGAHTQTVKDTATVNKVAAGGPAASNPKPSHKAIPFKPTRFSVSKKADLYAASDDSHECIGIFIETADDLVQVTASALPNASKYMCQAGVNLNNAFMVPPNAKLLRYQWLNGEVSESAGLHYGALTFMQPIAKRNIKDVNDVVYGRVFVRRSGANGLGHVGWAFQATDGTWSAGGIENENGGPYVNPDNKCMWSYEGKSHDEVLELMRNGGYDAYQQFVNTSSNVEQGYRDALVVVEEWLSKPYVVIGKNCMDATYEILTAYGWPMLPSPSDFPAPNDWFNELWTEEGAINI